MNEERLKAAIVELRKLGYKVFAAEGKLRLYWDSGRRRPSPDQVEPLLEQLRRSRKTVVSLLAKPERKAGRGVKVRRGSNDYQGMVYAEYLETARWQEVRRKALSFAGYRCQVCNAKDTELHVHHRCYASVGQEEGADVIVLCSECHALFHDAGKLHEHASLRASRTRG